MTGERNASIASPQPTYMTRIAFLFRSYESACGNWCARTLKNAGQERHDFELASTASSRPVRSSVQSEHDRTRQIQSGGEITRAFPLWFLTADPWGILLSQFACVVYRQTARVRGLPRPLLHGAQLSQRAKVLPRLQNGSGSTTRKPKPATSLPGGKIARPCRPHHEMHSARRELISDFLNSLRECGAFFVGCPAPRSGSKTRPQVGSLLARKIGSKIP